MKREAAAPDLVTVKIGTMHLGSVHALDEECIQTKFLVIGVPLVPLGSLYVVRDGYPTLEGFEIPLHGASVLAAYLRVLGGAAAAVGVGLVFFADQPGYLLLAALGVLAFAGSYLLGSLDPQERQRRVLLRELTGLGAPPELLPASDHGRLRAQLEACWARIHPDAAWTERALAPALDREEALLLHGLAEYADQPALSKHLRERLAA